MLLASGSGVLDSEPTLWAYLQPLSSVSSKHSLLSNCRFESPMVLEILPRANEEEAMARVTTNEARGPPRGFLVVMILMEVQHSCTLPIKVRCRFRLSGLS